MSSCAFQTRRLVIGLLGTFIAVAAVFGAGAVAPRTALASTTDLWVNPQTQLVGAPVSVFVNFNLDPASDPVVRLSRGAWDYTTMSPCVTGIGTSEAVIDDEACPPGPGPVQGAVLTTTCDKEGVVTVTSSSAIAGSPSQVSFTCTRERPTETRRAQLRSDTQTSARGKATLTWLGDLYMLEADARGLTASAPFTVSIVNDDDCGLALDIGFSDGRGRLAADGWTYAEGFLATCGTEPTRVLVAAAITGQVILTGALR